MSFWEYILALSAITAVPLGFLYLYEMFYDYNKGMAKLFDEAQEEKEREKEKGCD